MRKIVENQLGLSPDIRRKILHVLDIGCGRGQDIQKWMRAGVYYLVAVDFSKECIKNY